MKLEVTISCLKTELENEKDLKHESDSNVIELHKLMERGDLEIEKLNLTVSNIFRAYLVTILKTLASLKETEEVLFN